MSEKSVAELLKETKIREVINPRLIEGPPSLSLEEAILKMQEHGSGYIVLSEARNVTGIFTENDVVFKILDKKVDWSRPVADFMTESPMTLTPDHTIAEAIRLMGEHRFYHIPLIDQDKKLTGILSVRSLIRFLSEFYPTEVFNLPPDPDQIMESPEGG